MQIFQMYIASLSYAWWFLVIALAQMVYFLKGDSGGPVGCYDKKGVYYQVGIVSWGPTQICAGLGVYTRISKYRNWTKCYSYKV